MFSLILLRALVSGAERFPLYGGPRFLGQRRMRLFCAWGEFEGVDRQGLVP